MDIGTLNTVNMLLLLLHAGIVILLVRGSTYGRAAQWFAGSSLLRAWALAGLQPNFTGTVGHLAVAWHVVIVIGFVAMHRGFSEVLGLGRRWWMGVLGVGGVGAVAIVIAGMRSTRDFEIAFSATLSVLLATTAVMILRCRVTSVRSTATVVGGMFLLYAMVHGWRTLAVSFGGARGDAASLQLWLLGAVLANAGIVFGFLLLVTSQLRRTIECMAQRDPLTGVLNRLGLEQVIAPELERRRKSGSPVAAIMMDLDGMKRANDCYGHPCGDQVLVAVCGAMGSVLNGLATPARMGGDEFLVLLPGLNESDAVALAEPLRLAVEEIRLEDWPELRVSGSFGVASLPGSQWTLHDLLRASDEALLRAKAQGKNRVVI